MQWTKNVNVNFTSFSDRLTERIKGNFTIANKNFVQFQVNHWAKWDRQNVKLCKQTNDRKIGFTWIQNVFHWVECLCFSSNPFATIQLHIIKKSIFRLDHQMASPFVRCTVIWSSIGHESEKKRKTSRSFNIAICKHFCLIHLDAWLMYWKFLWVSRAFSTNVQPAPVPWHRRWFLSKRCTQKNTVKVFLG